MVNALSQQAPVDFQSENRASVHIESLLSSKKPGSRNPNTPSRSLVTPQGRKQFREVLESQNEVEAQRPKQLNSGSSIGKTRRTAKLAQNEAGQDATSRLPSFLNSTVLETYDESNHEVSGSPPATQQSEEIDSFDNQEQIAEDEQLGTTVPLGNQAPTLVWPPDLATTAIEPDAIDGKFIEDLGEASSSTRAPRAEPGVGKLESVVSSSTEGPPPGPEAATQEITSTLSRTGKLLTLEPAREQRSIDFVESEPLQTPFSKATLPLAYNLDSIFQVRVDVLKPIESAHDLFYMRNHLLQNSSAAFSGQNEHEPKLLDSSMDAFASLFSPEQIDPSLSSINRIPQVEQAFRDLEFSKRDSKESRFIEEATNTSQGTFEKVGGFSTATINSGPLDHKSKAPSASTAEPVVESAPLSKRNISQLVLRVGEDKESKIAVRLNMHGTGLRMEVLGGDTGLRGSLLGGLASLEKTLERQAQEGGWRVTSNSTSTDSHSITQASTASLEGETTGSQQEDVSGRSGQGEPQPRRKDNKKEQFTLTRETGNYK